MTTRQPECGSIGRQSSQLWALIASDQGHIGIPESGVLSRVPTIPLPATNAATGAATSSQGRLNWLRAMSRG